jgi:hypothetical protein
MQFLYPAIIEDLLKLELEQSDDIIDDEYKLVPDMQEVQLDNIIDLQFEFIILPRPATIADSIPAVIELELATIKFVVPTINVKRLLDVIPTPVPNATCVESIEELDPPVKSNILG